MLFYSWQFILLYLPLTLIVFFALARHNHALAAIWLAAASLGFYAYWNPAYLGLLLGSITFNFLAGYWISRQKGGTRYAALASAVIANLLLIGYFKYLNFFVDNVNDLFGTTFGVDRIILPLGISFFTFTQIAFLVDTYRGYVREYRFVHYILFVTYFPHLIAGPILHHGEMMPQFAAAKAYRFHYPGFCSGLSVFVIGLIKKVILADGIQAYVAPVFDAPAELHLGAVEAWGGALAYALQIYFDFSGYSDMAIGLSRMFGVELPLNFDSPYKACSIIDFWRRWHMTLSRFLRDYLYIPLGGNRRGEPRRYLNLLLTMLIGGLWHGAGWTFVIWGGLHGAYLAMNHAWLTIRKRLGWSRFPGLLGRFAGWLLTFVCVLTAWVFFRAESIDAAFRLLTAMFGQAADWRWDSLFEPTANSEPLRQLGWTVGLLVLALLAPNSQQITAALAAFGPKASQKREKPVLHFAVGFLASFVTVLTLIGSSKTISEFIYFNF